MVVMLVFKADIGVLRLFVLFRILGLIILLYVSEDGRRNGSWDLGEICCREGMY